MLALPSVLAINESFGLHARIAPPENRSLMLPSSASHTHILAPHGAARRSPSGLIPNERESTRTSGSGGTTFLVSPPSSAPHAPKAAHNSPTKTTPAVRAIIRIPVSRLRCCSARSEERRVG